LAKTSSIRPDAEDVIVSGRSPRGIGGHSRAAPKPVPVTIIGELASSSEACATDGSKSAGIRAALANNMARDTGARIFILDPLTNILVLLPNA
jgi:hypothetical protein